MKVEVQFCCGNVELLVGWLPFEQVVAGWWIIRYVALGGVKVSVLGLLGLLGVGARCLSRRLIH